VFSCLNLFYLSCKFKSLIPQAHKSRESREFSCCFCSSNYDDDNSDMMLCALAAANDASTSNARNEIIIKFDFHVVEVKEKAWNGNDTRNYIKIILLDVGRVTWETLSLGNRLKALNIISILTLLIDVKTEGESTHTHIHKEWKKRSQKLFHSLEASLFAYVRKLNYGHLNTFPQFAFNSKAFADFSFTALSHFSVVNEREMIRLSSSLHNSIN